MTQFHQASGDEPSVDRTRIAALVHDLKAPLQAVLGWVLLLKHKELQGRSLDEAVRIIERNVRFEADMLDELLEILQLAERPPRKDPTHEDLAELARSTTDAFRPVALDSAIELRIRTPEAPVLVMADRQDLERIVSNLIVNAIKFSDRGGTVDCSVVREGSWVRLIVRDDGRGIGPEFLPHVFDSFRRESHPEEPAREGTGLGLSVVRQLAQRYRGAVRAESRGRGRGATFTVTLPAAHTGSPAPWADVTAPLSAFYPGR